jgi:hypothetical protein
MEDFQNQPVSSQSNSNQPLQQKPKKHIPTWLGLVIIILAGILLFGGAFAYQFLVNKNQPEATNSLLNLANQTAGWKTYQNEKYGYGVKYPPNGSFSLSPSGIPNANDEGYKVNFKINDIVISITSQKNARNDKTIDELKEVRDFNGMKNVGIVKVPDYANKIVVGGQTAYKWSDTDKNNQKLGATVVAFNSGDYFYTIQTFCYPKEIGGPCLPEFNIERENIFDSFVSTFKFKKPIDGTLTIKSSEETKDWLTYTNAKYGYQLKYPVDWIITSSSDTGVSLSSKSYEPTVTIRFKSRQIGRDWFWEGKFMKDFDIPEICNFPFEDVITRQVFQSESVLDINSFKRVIIENSQVNAYEATWNYQDMLGGLFYVSNPIVYFEPENKVCGHVEISLENKTYSNIFDKILSTFKFINK